MFHSFERWGWYKKYSKKVQALYIMSIDRMRFRLVSMFLINTMDDVEILFTETNKVVKTSVWGPLGSLRYLS